MPAYLEVRPAQFAIIDTEPLRDGVLDVLEGASQVVGIHALAAIGDHSREPDRARGEGSATRMLRLKDQQCYLLLIFLPSVLGHVVLALIRLAHHFDGHGTGEYQ